MAAQNPVMAFLLGPTGPKTGASRKAIMDAKKDPEQISLNMSSVLALYSMLFMRFAWMVQPRNYLMLAVHAVNEGAQLNLLQKKLRHDYFKETAAAAAAPPAKLE